MRAQLPRWCAFLFFVPLLAISCRLPGMLPLTPLPDMERDLDFVLETLNGDDWLPLAALVEERYTEEDYAEPGTLTFTATITNEKPVFFSYGWCAADEQTLMQNFEHITVRLLINDDEVPGDAAHGITYSSPDGWACLEVGTLLSDWSAGEYELKTAVTFDEQINDGRDDFDAGEYIYIYDVNVEE